MSLSVIYALIARDNKIILSDYTEYTGNFQQASLVLLRKIPKNSKIQIDYPPYVVFCEDIEDVTYILIASNIKQDVAFSFLSDLRKKFLTAYDSYIIKQSYSYTLKNFSAEIKTIVRFYEDNQYYVKSDILMDDKGNKIKIEEKKVDDFLNKDEIVDIRSTKLSSNGVDVYDEYKIKSRQLEKKKRTRMIKLAIGILLIIILIFIYSKL